MCSRLRLTAWPPLRPAFRASSESNSCAVPFACAAFPPLLAISRCLPRSIDAKPRLLRRPPPLCMSRSVAFDASRRLRSAASSMLWCFLGLLVGHIQWSPDGTRCDAIYANLLFDEILGERLRKGVYRALRRGVIEQLLTSL